MNRRVLLLLAACTVALAQNPYVLAEWVIDEETAKIATDCGIDYLQGFHLGRPVEVEEVVSTPEDR